MYEMPATDVGKRSAGVWSHSRVIFVPSGGARKRAFYGKQASFLRVVYGLSTPSPFSEVDISGISKTPGIVCVIYLFHLKLSCIVMTPVPLQHVGHAGHAQTCLSIKRESNGKAWQGAPVPKAGQVQCCLLFARNKHTPVLGIFCSLRSEHHGLCAGLPRALGMASFISDNIAVADVA